MKAIPQKYFLKEKKVISQPKTQKKAIIFLVGPTAIGKSQIAIYLARKINAEIISCDSMQIYKKMDIISAKPDSVFRKKVKHNLISIIDPSRAFSACDYRRLALAAVKDIIRRGRVPLFVGGCGFYMSAVIDGIFSEKTKDKSIRERLYLKAQRLGNGTLYASLKAVDPAAASKIHPNDLRRIVRALEVYQKCGIPISELQKRRKGIADKYNIEIFGLNMKRDALYRRIDERVDAMFKSGLLNEIKALLKSRLSRTAAVAIGLRQIQAYLGGQYDLAEAIRLMKRNSRLYAKKQLTWFKKDKRIKWLVIKDSDSARHIAQRICKGLEWKKHC